MRHSKKILLTLILLLTGSAFGSLSAFNSKNAIALLRRGDPKVLTGISPGDFLKLHNYQGKYYYIARNIGRPALRSLFACFKNPNNEVKRLCADNLYQMKLTYVHKKLVLHYMEQEKHPPTRLALQDLLVRINEERFARARKIGDSNFLSKVSFMEISEFVEKGYPSGEEYTDRDYNFLRGGAYSKEVAMRIYSIKMLGRLPDTQGRTKRLLLRLKSKEKSAAVKSEITKSLSCLKNPNSCPDLY